MGCALDWAAEPGIGGLPFWAENGTQLIWEGIPPPKDGSLGLLVLSFQGWFCHWDPRELVGRLRVLAPLSLPPPRSGPLLGL